ncbi:SDH family Clp fold serine proteinase [Myxococcus sp. 1LA]
MQPVVPKSPAEWFNAAAQLWANSHGAPTLTIWLRDQDSIRRGIAEEVFRELQPLSTPVDELWVMLNSVGGDLNGAYQIARRLQSTAKTVRVVIPRMAKSAATLITLGCHEVVMHPLAELGPIDTQTDVLRAGKRMMRSTLDVMRSIEYLREFAMNSYVRVAKFLVDYSATTPYQLPIEQATPSAATVMNALVEPIFSQIDPIQMAECYRLLDVSREYGRRLMSVSYTTMAEGKREDLLSKMAEGYPAHGFIIDFKEAEELGLRSREATPDERTLLDFGVIFAGDRVRSIKLYQPQPAPVADR